MTAPADHPAKPDRHSPQAQRCQLPKAAQTSQKCQSNDAEASTPRNPRRPPGRDGESSEEGLLTISPQEAPRQRRGRRRISGVAGGLRSIEKWWWERGGEGEFSGRVARGVAASTTTTKSQVEALPLRDLRQALFFPFSIARALGGAPKGEGRRGPPRRGSSAGRGAEGGRGRATEAAPATSRAVQRRLRGLRPAAFGGGESARRRDAERRRRGLRRVRRPGPRRCLSCVRPRPAARPGEGRAAAQGRGGAAARGGARRGGGE